MKREQEIDIAKGIAIIMVIIGHSYSSGNVITRIINAFHMPFFFIVSGILYRLQYDQKGYCSFNYKNKISNLILPWVIWGSIYQLFLSGLRIIGGDSISSNIKIFVEQFLCLDFGAVWFLPALYIAAILFFTTLKNKKLNIIIAILCMVVGLYAPEGAGIINSIFRAILGCGFIAVGFYGSPFLYKNNTHLFMNIFIMVIFCRLAVYNGNVAMYYRKFGKPIVFAITGVLGTYSLLCLCKFIKQFERNLFIEKLKLYGRKSIVVLCLHNFFIEIIKVIDYKLFSNGLMTLGIGEGILISLITLVFVTLLFPICDKYLKFTFGCKQLLK